jgi:hypothetical protein
VSGRAGGHYHAFNRDPKLSSGAGYDQRGTVSRKKRPVEYVHVQCHVSGSCSTRSGGPHCFTQEGGRCAFTIRNLPTNYLWSLWQQLYINNKCSVTLYLVATHARASMAHQHNGKEDIDTTAAGATVGAIAARKLQL